MQKEQALFVIFLLPNPSHYNKFCIFKAKEELSFRHLLDYCKLKRVFQIQLVTKKKIAIFSLNRLTKITLYPTSDKRYLRYELLLMNLEILYQLC